MALCWEKESRCLFFLARCRIGSIAFFHLALLHGAGRSGRVLGTTGSSSPTSTALAARLALAFARGLGTEQQFVEIHQLDHRHLGTITFAKAGLDDPYVSTGAIAYLGYDGTEKFLDGGLTLEVAKNYPTGVSGIVLGLGNQRFDVATQGFGFGQGRGDPLVRNQGIG